ncbi:MAG: structural protein P5 [Bacteroidota bacterium]
MSRGLRNNNPGNIRKGGDTFQGEKTPSRDLEFKEFYSIDYGYRAIFVTLATYITKGFDTVEKIINRWAPATENDTKTYINTVVRLSGVSAKAKITTQSGEVIKKIVAGMSFVENGKAADMSDVEKGFKLQNRIVC